MSRLDRWIFRTYETSPATLGIYRVLFALFVLLVVVPGHTANTDFARLANFPDTFFVPPPGPMMLFSGFPPAYVFHALLVVIYVSAAALLLGYRTRVASVLLGVALLTSYGFLYSFGKTNHNLLFLIVPLVMVFSGWGCRYAVDASGPRGGEERDAALAWPVALLALLVGFGMLTAGAAKLVSGWLDPTTAAVRGQLYNHFFVNGRQDLLAPWYLQVDSAWFWEAIDYLTVIFEIGVFVAVLSRTSLRILLAVAVIFHFNVMLMFNIPFAENLIVYAAFVDWSRLLPDAVLQALQQSLTTVGRHPLAAPALVLLVGGAFYAWGSPLLALDPFAGFTSDLTLHEALVLSLAFVAAIWYLARVMVRTGRRLARERRDALRREAA